MSVSTYVSRLCKYYEKCLYELIKDNNYIELSYPIEEVYFGERINNSKIVHFYNLRAFANIELFEKLRYDISGIKSAVAFQWDAGYNNGLECRNSILGKHNISFEEFKNIVEMLVLSYPDKTIIKNNLSIRLLKC